MDHHHQQMWDFSDDDIEEATDADATYNLGYQSSDGANLIQDLDPIKQLDDLRKEADFRPSTTGHQQLRKFILSHMIGAFYVLTGISIIVFLFTGSILPLSAVLAFFLALISKLTS
ncbi:HPP family protein [Ktedonobacter racemifer]|uniref:Uncharacterized protein n=1 Tax=Ktedonobacter racemifer DSM 44963 TaxID=485913 RepID=D6TH19_KTERA|nr:HPP family protein [Ktedonobacter racemifer]EFH88948.1 hypothetical protein Krac_10464 [Ktedonobacter racemifer DSM 44963]